jgi:hypothetical protein
VGRRAPPGSAAFRCFVPYSVETRSRVAATFSSFWSLALPRPLELLCVVIFERRYLDRHLQSGSVIRGPWVGSEMGVFQSPDLRIAEAKDVIDL